MFGRSTLKQRPAGRATVDESKARSRQKPTREETSAGSEPFDGALEQFREQWDRLRSDFRERQDQCLSALIALCERLHQRQREQAETLQSLEREAAELRDQREQHDRWVSEIAQLRKERNQLASEATQLREQRDALASEVAQLREERDQSVSEATQLREERDQLASEAAQLSDERKLLAAELQHRMESLAELAEPAELTEVLERRREARSPEPAGNTGPHAVPRTAPPEKTPARETPTVKRREPARAAKSPAVAKPVHVKKPRPTPPHVEGARIAVFPDNDQNRIDAKLHQVTSTSVSLIVPKLLKIDEYVIIEMSSASQRIEVEVRAFVRQVEPLTDGGYLVGFALITQLEFREVQGLRSN